MAMPSLGGLVGTDTSVSRFFATTCYGAVTPPSTFPSGVSAALSIFLSASGTLLIQHIVSTSQHTLIRENLLSLTTCLELLCLLSVGLLTGRKYSPAPNPYIGLVGGRLPSVRASFAGCRATLPKSS